MNHEEKILAMLTEMKATQDKTEAALAALTTTVAKQGEQIAEMRDTLTRVAVTQEGVVLPRIQALAEGYDRLDRRMDALATKEQVEKLAGDVDVIKSVVTQHSREISLLKKAQ